MRLPDHLTIYNFTHPAGPATQTNIILRDYLNRYRTHIERTISYKVYKDHDRYVFVCKLPSEKNKKYNTKIMYDIVIEFYKLNPNDTPEQHTKLTEYGMKVFSNCPTFMFNFTNVYKKIGCLYTKFPRKDMYSEKALEDNPDKTNPYKVVGVEKSVWFCLSKIYRDTQYNTKNIDKQLTILKDKFPSTIFDTILSQEEKLEESSGLLKSTKGKDSKRILVINGKKVVSEDRNSKSKNKHISRLNEKLDKKIQEDKQKRSILSSNLNSNKLKADMSSSISKPSFFKSFTSNLFKKK